MLFRSRLMHTAVGNQERADAAGMRRQEVERRLEEIRALLHILRYEEEPKLRRDKNMEGY